MTILQLEPPLPVVTPKGEAIAHFMIDYGPESHLHWVCFQDETGECWTWPNPEIRASKNITLGRTHVTPFHNSVSNTNVTRFKVPQETV